MQEWLYLLPGITLAVLLLAIAHWFPWIRRLPRMWAYRIGVACLWCGFALWRLLLGDWVTTLGLLALCLVAGFAVASYYWIDAQVDQITDAFNRAEKGNVMLERMLDDDRPT